MLLLRTVGFITFLAEPSGLAGMIPRIDGSFLLGLAGFITALTGAGILGSRGLAKQKAGVPAREADIDHDLLRDRARLLKEAETARQRLIALDQQRRNELEAAEQRRAREYRVLSNKIEEVVRQRNDAIDVTVQNRRLFIEKYGADGLKDFVRQPSIEETWRPEELQELRNASRGDTTKTP